MPNNIVITSILGFVGLMGIYLSVRSKRSKKNIMQADVSKMEAELKTQNNLAFKAEKLFDLTAAITSDMTVFPGDPLFEDQQVARIGCGDSHFDLRCLRLSNHLGTHIDFPSHVIPGGKNSDAYTLEDLQGEGIIIEVPNSYRSINEKFIKQQEDLKDKIVFFKTNNTKISKYGKFNNNYIYIEPEAANALATMKVKIVGIDYLSVDNNEAHVLPVHQILLSNNILIVENLDLREVDPGKCKIVIAPLKIANIDGTPARVFMLR